MPSSGLSALLPPLNQEITMRPFNHFCPKPVPGLSAAPRRIGGISSFRCFRASLVHV